MVRGSDSPPVEGQFITYTCPPGFIVTGLDVSVCMGNGEWEPDPGEVECIGDATITQYNTHAMWLDLYTPISVSIL